MSEARMVERWFPCVEVDAAVGTPAGSGLSEKAIFTWFASRPIAQARAAVLAALLSDDVKNRALVREAVGGNLSALDQLAKERIRSSYPNGPLVLDMFSGRAMIPLEAARLGVRAVGIDYSPVATLAGRLLADFPLRDWGDEPCIPFPEAAEPASVLQEPRLVVDVRALLAEIGRRLQVAVTEFYPANADGQFPWGYLWAITIPCDACGLRFPLVGSLTLRHPYWRTEDPGQSFAIRTGDSGWWVEISDGPATQTPTMASAGRGGKSGRCPFCGHVHSLDNIKAKGFAGEYRDEPLLAADHDEVHETRKVFRPLRREEREAATRATARLAALPPFGKLAVVPDEAIPPGNEDTVRGSGYGFRTYGELMNARQTLQFVETVRIIRNCYQELLAARVSVEYATALTSYAAATMVRRIRRATRGAKLQGLGNSNGSAQNRNKVDHIFADESKISFQFDYFESGPGDGPGTWKSIAQTGLAALAKHLKGLNGRPARIAQGSALALPFRDGTVEAVVTDPPYYNMIDYCDVSDLFYVWLKRTLYDVLPELFGGSGLQDKREEIIVKRGGGPHDHRTVEHFERSLEVAFREARRVLRPDGALVVVYGNTDPDAWKRLLVALYNAGFTVAGTWPTKTETANTGVASIRVTVVVGCRPARAARPTTTAAQADREVVELVRTRVSQWERDGLAMSDQLMAAYGPAMEVYCRYSKILQPDGTAAPIDRYLELAPRAAREAAAMRVDTIPLDAFDPLTRFAVFWLRSHGRSVVPKSMAVFFAQVDNLRLTDMRGSLLTETKAGFRVLLDALTGPVTSESPVFDVVRGMLAGWKAAGTDGVAQILAVSGRGADDTQIWAVVAELARLVPEGDPDGRALAALQRNSASIRHAATGAAEAQAAPEQLALLWANGTRKE